MMARAARNRFHSSLLSFLGRRGPSCWCFCQRANSSSRLALTCFHCAFAGILRGELLGLDHDRLALGERCGDECLRLLGLLLGQLGDGAAERLEPRAAGPRGLRPRWPSTTFAVSDLTALAMSAAGAPRLARCSRSVTWPGELGELALEVGERLLGRAIGVLADGAFALGFADEDGSRLVDATPGGLFVSYHVVHLVRIEAGRAGARSAAAVQPIAPAFGGRIEPYLIVTAVIFVVTTGVRRSWSSWSIPMPAARCPLT